MKQMARGAMAVLALIGISACVSDPQERINNDDFHILQAYPEVMWVKAGVVGGTTDSTSVYFRLINDFGNGTPTHLTLKGVTGTIRVRQDTTYREYYTGGDPNDTTPVPYLDGHLQRWFVFTNFQPGEGTFTLEASNGVQTTVHVRVEASNLGALPTQTALPGQLITLTAPAFETFAPDAVVTYLRGARPKGYPCTVTPVIGGPSVSTGVCAVGQTTSDTARGGTSTSAGPITVAADGKSLTFRAAFDMRGVIRVSKNLPAFSGLDPALFSTNAVQLQTTDTLHVLGLGTQKTYDYTYGASTDTITTTGGSTVIGSTTVSTANPGDVVKLTFGGFPGSLGTTAGTVPIGMLATSRIFVGGVEAGIVFTSASPAVAAIGADSTSVSILVPAHISPPAGQTTVPITATNVAFTFDPTYLFGVAGVAATAVQTGNPAILKLGTFTGTGNIAPVTNYAGVAARSQTAATQLPDLSIFPSSAANARSFIINDANPFFPATAGSDCALAIYASAVSPTTRTVGGCKIYRIAFQTTRIVEAELRWATGVAGADLAVFSLAETGNVGTLLQAPCPSSVTAPAIFPVGCQAGNVNNTTGGKQPGTATSNSALPAAPTLTFPSVTSVNGQYIAIVWYSSNGSVAPAWTSLRLTVR